MAPVPPSSPLRRLGEALPWLLAMGVAVAFNAAFQGPMARDPAHRLLAGAFHGGHLWCFDYAWRMLAGLDPWSVNTERLGFPGTGSVRCLALVPAFAAAPSRWFLPELATYNLTILLTPAVAVYATMRLARAVTTLDAWAAGAAGVVYAVCPYVLGCFAGGQTCKAQVWSVPLVLWMVTGAVRGPRRALHVLGAGVAGALLAWSEPTYATIVPLVAVPWAILLLRRPLLPHALGGLLALGLLAAGIGSGALYYLRPDDPGTEAVFEPAGRLTSAGIPLPAPMAEPAPTLLGPPPLQTDPGAPNHVTYLGLPLLGAMLLGSVLRWEGRRLAWMTLLVGFVVALGERLVMNDAFVLTNGRPTVLPAYWLAQTGYPLARSMMYYRGIAVAALGVALGAMGVFGRHRYGAAGAWAVAALTLWDTHRVLEPIWPLRSAVFDTAMYEAMRADPLPGAVVGLPLRSSTRSGGLTVLDAAFHGRPTNGLVRFTDNRMAHVAKLEGWFKEANRLPATEASAYLYERGVRYIVAGEETTEGEKMNLTLSYGRPQVLSRRMVWRVGPN